MLSTMITNKSHEAAVTHHKDKDGGTTPKKTKIVR